MKRFLLPLLALSALQPLAPKGYSQSTPSAEEMTESLMQVMTLDEKVGQLIQASYNYDPQHQANILKWGQQGRLGSVFNLIGAKEFNALQAQVINRSRLRIPLLNGLDVIHGYRTQFPIPLAMSCSWNPDLVERAARISAIEARAGGINWTFSPMVDIARDPRWGRIAEGNGEDPFLGAAFAAAYVRGYQTDDLTAPTAIAACVKHFAGYGATEGGRDYNTTLIPEAELRNIYLPPFKAAIDAGVVTVMSAFNDLNGVPASGNRFLLTDLLRGEWGFTGFVVSDWESVKELSVHGYADGPRDAARLGLLAGVDMEMVSRHYADHAVDLVRAGEVPLKALDDATRRILLTKFRLGLFEQPFAPTDLTSKILSPEHREVAREVAAESMVLLKNSGDHLPLASTVKKILVVGPLADSKADMLGTWACQGQPEDAITLVEGLRTGLPTSTQVTYLPVLTEPRDTSEAGFAAAVTAAAEADVIIAAVGESAASSGEARVRAFLNLPGAQGRLLAALKATGKPLIAVVFAGRPLETEELVRSADALLYAWHPGTMAGPAVTDVLTGRRSPAGRLTTTFPRTVGQIPLYYNHRNTGRPPEDENPDAPMGTPQDPRGYTSKYLDVHSSPAFPFGFGLTYTTFRYEDLRISEPNTTGARVISVLLTNTGSRSGIEVAQLYLRDPVASLTRPVRELKGFQRVALAPGEAKRVEFTLSREALGFYDAQGRYLIEAGRFEVFVGADATTKLGGEFLLK